MSVKILYIPEGFYLPVDFNTVDKKYESKEGHILYIKDMIYACNFGNSSYVWNLPKNTIFILSEFEVIYD